MGVSEGHRGEVGEHKDIGEKGGESIRRTQGRGGESLRKTYGRGGESLRRT